jgi:hypothetical protein
MRLKHDALGNVEIVGNGALVGCGQRRPASAAVGGILSSATDYANLGEPTPTEWSVTVYRQYKKRFGGELFWDRETGFSGSTKEDALRKAQEYVNGKGWKLTGGVSGIGADKPTGKVGLKVKPPAQKAVEKSGRPLALQRVDMGSGKYRLTVRQTRPEDNFKDFPYIAEIVEIGAKYPNQLVHVGPSPELALTQLMNDPSTIDLLQAVTDVQFKIPKDQFNRIFNSHSTLKASTAHAASPSGGFSLFSFSNKD